MRSLPLGLEVISLGNTTSRKPAWIVQVYDVRSTTDTIRDIVLGNDLLQLTGPFNATDYVDQVSVLETAGDYVDSGVSASQIQVQMQDPDGRFDPHALLIDPEADGRFFRSGNVVRIWEGDEQVDPALWPLTFTGIIAGQYGYNRSRASGDTGISMANFRALGRESTFIQFERTSDTFTAGQTYSAIANSIAENQMGLDVDEINFAGFGAQVLPHKTVQLVKENPMSMLAKVMFVDGFLPKFQGDGRLAQVSGLISAGTNRFYNDQSHIISIERPISDVTPPNSVCVVGLDADLSRVDQPPQLIAEVSVTTGYFTSDESIDAFWSDDRTTLAENPSVVTVKSVAGVIGGGETFTYIGAPNDDGGQVVGTIGVRITINTGFAPWLSIFLLTSSVAAAAIPDFTLPFGGPTIPSGRIAQAITMSSALNTMAKIGKGEYEFYGTPFEYVYKELRQCARVDGVGEFEINEIVIENHLVNEDTDAINIARDVLFRQQATKNPRTVLMYHDLALEPDDIFEVLSTDQRFLVSEVSRVLRRDASVVIAQVTAFEITTGIGATS